VSDADYILRPIEQSDTAYVRAMYGRGDWISPSPHRSPADPTGHVCCLASNPSYILAYAVACPRHVLCMDYLFTRHEWERLGIASFMLDRLTPTTYAARTPKGLRLLRKRFESGKHCPKFKQH
jgi:hypothetical protein